MTSVYFRNLHATFWNALISFLEAHMCECDSFPQREKWFCSAAPVCFSLGVLNRMVWFSTIVYTNSLSKDIYILRAVRRQSSKLHCNFLKSRRLVLWRSTRGYGINYPDYYFISANLISIFSGMPRRSLWKWSFSGNISLKLELGFESVLCIFSLIWAFLYIKNYYRKQSILHSLYFDLFKLKKLGMAS